MNYCKIKIIDFFKNRKIEINMATFVVITYVFLALISIGAIFYALHYKTANTVLEKVIKEKEKIISDKSEKIGVLFDNIERLSGFELRVNDLEDDINRIDSMNMRLNIQRVECPLSDNELKLFSKLITDTLFKGGRRKDLEALMLTQDKIIEITINHNAFITYQRSLEKIKINDKKKEKPSKNRIGRIQ